ncbi:Wzz/FepE/Etk N-terminal domain-containing protein [Bradyrhizobium xenonodulans]|uniref:Wzz/FepE/Etk N-terminal domain-containing protein n=1 Tax=Bradyrhizobium xenonodulans TaxID=2736875 RepID=A0ABY7MRS7_9BRAD|nr:Wzz/FepE/Etk N-terminal domain-containing protein [Bradyrhizobium xenonodulans]WBL80336.1 Wzz/FepE/Etk N-terminal domain-containing protein [Bradyrhizobium xenonodulans]
MTSLERPDYRVILRPQVDDHRAAEKEIEQSDSLELFVLRALRRYWLISAAVFVLGILFAVLLHALLDTKYEATASLLIDNGKQSEANQGSDSVFVNSQIELLNSELVLRSAIQNVSDSKLYPRSPDSEFSQLLAYLGMPQKKMNNEDRAYKLAARALKVQLEPRTSMIRVSFRHQDPRLAASFVNGLTESYLSKYRALYTQAGAADFLRGEVDQLQRKVGTAASVLGAFVTANRTYSIDEQKKLLLTRQSDLAKSMATVRTELAQKQEELRVVEEQISQLKPNAARASQARDPSKPAPETAVPLPYNRNLFGDDPPLLLVKLYQETTQQFLTLKMTIAGLRAAESAHAAELDNVAKDLATLAGLESETNRLKRQLGTAEQELAEITSRAGEKRIATAMTENNLSAIKIAQPASVPFETAGRSVWLFLAIGSFLSALIAVGVACALQLISAYRNPPTYVAANFFRTVRFYMFFPS